MHKKVKKITIRNIVYLKNEIKDCSLKSIGLNENFSCEVELEE